MNAKGHSHKLRALVTVVAAIVLSGCAASGPLVEPVVGTSPRDARIALELAARSGPVSGRVEGLPDGPDTATTEQAILAVMGDAVEALSVGFTTTAPADGAPILVVTLGALPGANPCLTPPAFGEPTLVAAAFCANDQPIGAVFGTAEGEDDAARTRLYRRLARTLFPNLYAERYGIGYGLESLGLPTGGAETF